jgi:L-seryl-tRNA(Ser) seleniumtransferase
MSAHLEDPRRSVPSVDRLLASSAFARLLQAAPRSRVVAALQAVQDGVRARIAAGESVAADAEWYANEVHNELARVDQPSLRRVINATGVVLHTNLGRAPLATEAIQAMQRVAAGYTNLEYDVEQGRRGSRYAHCESLLCELTGAQAALVVNNNAAALVLALSTIGAGRGVLVSRGELVEIGGEFRVPEIVARSGARLVEVGATNRTRRQDYERALDRRIAALLKVHRSNFRMDGFVEEAHVAELASLAHAAGVLLVHDLGSGLLLEPPPPILAGEPTPQRALAAGADIVAISGDKLLGGPQAGVLLGRADLIDAMRRNPLCRALRVDKLTLAALEATLALYRDPQQAQERVPVLRMITAEPAVLEQRARAIAAQLGAARIQADTLPSQGAVGGGALPDLRLPGFAVAIETGLPAAQAEARLRAGTPPVVALVRDGRVLLDVRTVAGDEEAALVEAVGGLRP